MLGSFLKVGALVAVLWAFVYNMQEHNEAALLSDWSSPPPWPIFIAVNVLAGSLRAAADALTPPPIIMLDYAFSQQKLVLANWIQKFKVADLVAAKGPVTCKDLAASLGQDEGRLTRMMYGSASLGMFRLGKPDPANGAPRFVNTALSAVIRVDHPNSVAAFIGHMADDSYAPWGKLPEAMQKGVVAWDLEYPQYPAPSGIWQLYEDNPVREEQFGKAMTALDGLGAVAMVDDGPWGKFKRAIDVGGGRGHFLHRLLSKFKNLEGILLDRPPVIALAKQAWVKDGPFGGTAIKRISFASGSFLEAESLPPAQDGDVFYARYILHDWPPAESELILRNIRKAMGSKKATLLIGECALPDHDTIGPVSAMYQIDLQMLTVFGDAQERTPKQWEVIMTKTGFKIKAFHATRSLVHWVEAVPV